MLPGSPRNGAAAPRYIVLSLTAAIPPGRLHSDMELAKTARRFRSIQKSYRGTSFIRNSVFLGFYIKTMPRALR